MIKRTFKCRTWLLEIFLVVNISLGFITNVSMHVSQLDMTVFRTTLGLKKPAGPLTYAQQIELIRSVQARIFDRVPPGEPISKYAGREPEVLLRFSRIKPCLTMTA